MGDATETDGQATIDERIFDARPDTLDFRDRMYEPTLIEVEPVIDLEEYREWKVPVLDQGTEGACTGFGLATVANYLLSRRRVRPDRTTVSPRMLYEMARRYDEWPGEDYPGSSARGAMKGWHKHGVCSETEWPYSPTQADSQLTDRRAKDAVQRPLGAYLRVNHTDLVAMHSALAEVGILYATARVHSGWDKPGADGVIEQTSELLGGHAFAIVAYDERGFWIQNSWGEDWGHKGFALITYDDWLINGTDVWVARLGAPLRLCTPAGTARTHSAGGADTAAYSYSELRPHILTLGNDGRLANTGMYATTPADVKTILLHDFIARTEDWDKRRLLLYAHGGLVSQDSLVQRVADFRATMLKARVYPLAINWRSDFWATLGNILAEALRQRRPERSVDATMDFMLDRLDDALEPAARTIGGKAQWDEMKENALGATERSDGGLRLVCDHLAELVKKYPNVEIHLLGHSAGSVMLARLIQLLATPTREKIAQGPMAGQTGYGVPITTCTLWAAACTIELFKQAYVPAIKQGRIEQAGIKRFALFTLTDTVERDDHCARLYHKSLLYLVANAFEDRPRLPLIHDDGVPLLGMARFINKDNELKELLTNANSAWVLTPNDGPKGSVRASRADRHGGFGSDETTLRATLARILGEPRTETTFTITQTESRLRDRRNQVLSAAWG